MERKNLQTTPVHLHIKTSDGHLINNRLVTSGSDKIVIFSHGIASDSEEDGAYTVLAEEILAPDYDSIRFDFRGHGASEILSTEMTVAGEILDFLAIIDWAQHQGYKSLYHVASSFGASITLLTISRYKSIHFDRVVFWNPVTNYTNTFVHPVVEWGNEFLGQKYYNHNLQPTHTCIPETNFIIGGKLALELLYYPVENVKWPTNAPLLIIHGDADTAVPYTDSKHFTTANPDTHLKTFAGVDHGFDKLMPEAIRITDAWLRGSNIE